MFKAIKRVKKMGIIAFLMIIQLSIGLTMINSAGRLYLNSQNRKKGIESLFDVKNTTFIVTSFLRDEKKEQENNYNSEELESLWSLILKNENVEQICIDLKKEGKLKDFYLYAANGNIYDKFKEDRPEKYRKVSEDVESLYIGELVINENFFNHYDFKISKGRNLVKEDFNKNYKEENIPILFGKDFDGIYKLGETFTVENFAAAERIDDKNVDLIKDYITFEIVGFLEEDTIPIRGGPFELFASTLIYSNGIRIIPVVNDYLFYSFQGQAPDTGIFLERADNLTEEELVKILREKFSNENISFRTYDLINTTATIESYERDVKSSLILGILLLILSEIGIICIILGQLKKRKKEFGIKISMGATLNKISKDIFLDILLIVSIATAISTIINLQEGFNRILLEMNIVLVIINTIFISIIPIIELKKIEIVELMKEK